MKRSLAALALAGSVACDDPASVVPNIPPPTVERCTQSIPRTFQVYFVVNVSRSMSEYLEALALELESFADGFPDVDVNGDLILVNYYVVAFVNDVGFFPEGAPRMTSSIAVAQAIEDAVDRGRDNRNLDGSDNGEINGDENLLDALGAALDNGTEADRVLFLIATEDNFRNQGERLSPNFIVENDYLDIRERLLTAQEKGLVYAFTDGTVEGIDRNFDGNPPLFTDGRIDLNALLDSSAVSAILGDIAQEVACGDDETTEP